MLSAEEEKELGHLIIEENDPWAREKLVRSNLRLVVNLAKKFRGRGMGLADLIEEGNLGLIKAVDYFDPERGTRFSTYAAWWIKQSMKRALLENVQPVHIPTYMVTLINQWRRTISELEVMLGRTPTLDEAREAMNLSGRKARVVDKMVKMLNSVHQSSQEEDEAPAIAALVEDGSGPRPEDQITESEEIRKALRLLEEIDSREASILRMHYGLDGKKPIGLKEIGEKMGLTRERIRQIQREALTKLYYYMEGDEQPEQEE